MLQQYLQHKKGMLVYMTTYYVVSPYHQTLPSFTFPKTWGVTSLAWHIVMGSMHSTAKVNINLRFSLEAIIRLIFFFLRIY